MVKLIPYLGTPMKDPNSQKKFRNQDWMIEIELGVELTQVEVERGFMNDKCELIGQSSVKLYPSLQSVEVD